MKMLQGSILFGLLSLNLACSSFRHSEGGALRDSTLSNLNPAPKSITPPDYTNDGSSPVLDDTYLSSQADYHFTMGETLSYEGQSPRSIEEYKLTLIYDPKSVHVRLRLAAEYVRMGMITEAVEQGEIAVEMAPQSIDARMLLGGLYAGLKMFDQAVGQFDQILKIEPGHQEASIYLGALLAEQKKYDEAIQYFQALANNKKFEDTEKAYYYIGRIRSEQGATHFAEAEKAFAKALELKPEYPEAAMAMAAVYRAQERDKDMEGLLSSYQDRFGGEREMARALSQYYLEHEDFDKALEQLESLDSFERDNLNIKIQIALILIEQKKYEAAAARLEDVLQQAPESDKVRYYLGAVYEEIGRYNLALDHYKKIPASSTYFAEAIVHSAHMLKTAGRLDKAVDLMENAIRGQDDLPQLYAYYATLLDDKKDYRKAFSMLTKAVDKFPNNTQLRFFLGTMHDRLGNSKGTVEQMRLVIQQDKEHVQALNYLAYTMAEMGDNLDEATELASRALAIQPNDAYILDTIGWIHFKKGDTEQAIRFLEAAYAAKSDESIIAEHLGDAYLRHQMWQKAQKLYQKAANLEKDSTRNKQIRQKIANLQSQVQQPSRAPASLPTPTPQ